MYLIMTDRIFIKTYLYSELKDKFRTKTQKELQINQPFSKITHLYFRHL